MLLLRISTHSIHRYTSIADSYTGLDTEFSCCTNKEKVTLTESCGFLPFCSLPGAGMH